MKPSNAKLVSCLIGVLGASTATAQFAVNWASLDAGGGPSAGGGFSLTSTIGQPDAGRMSNGPYAVTGGFWSLAQVGQAPTPSSSLSIERLPGGGVRVFWTRPADGILLEEVSAITGSSFASWTVVPPATYQTNATHIYITIPNPTGMRVYRLRH